MSIYEYPKRAMSITTPDSYDIRRHAENEVQYRAGVCAAINDHAIMITELSAKMSNLYAFMEWVSSTHPYVWAQYKAIEDLKEASK